MKEILFTLEEKNKKNGKKSPPKQTPTNTQKMKRFDSKIER